MSDRELLELAAKAAGLAHATPMMIEWGEWNPLTDDGDALRLAVMLEMDVCIDNKKAIAYGNHDGPPPIETGPDAYANARRAIVREAAEIGRRMQHE